MDMAMAVQDNMTKEHLQDGGLRLTLSRGREQEKLLHIGSLLKDVARLEILCGEGSLSRLLLTSAEVERLQELELEIRQERGSQLTLYIVQQYEGGALGNLALTAGLQEGAILNLYAFPIEIGKSIGNNIGKSDVEKGDVEKGDVGSLGNRQRCNSFTVNLEAPHAECTLGGVYITAGSARLSTTVNLNHISGEAKSKQLFKGVLADSSVTTFQGRITVLKDAQKTQAYQANNNLLLSSAAHAYTRPHLVINADDVQCSHGATVGSLNEEELFYMRSRGISLEEAKLLQQQAFVHEVTDSLPHEEAKEIIVPLLEAALRQTASAASLCA